MTPIDLCNGYTLDVEAVLRPLALVVVSETRTGAILTRARFDIDKRIFIDAIPCAVSNAQKAFLASKC